MMGQDPKFGRLALFFLLSILLFIPINSYADTIVPSVDGMMRDYPLDDNVDFFYTNSLLGQYVPDYQGSGDTEPVGLEDRGFVEFNIQGLVGSSYASLKLTEWYPLAYGNSDGSVDLYA